MIASLARRIAKIEASAPAEPLHVEIVRFSDGPLPAPILGERVNVSFIHHGAEQHG